MGVFKFVSKNSIPIKIFDTIIRFGKQKNTKKEVRN